MFTTSFKYYFFILLILILFFLYYLFNDNILFFLSNLNVPYNCWEWKRNKKLINPIYHILPYSCIFVIYLLVSSKFYIKKIYLLLLEHPQQMWNMCQMLNISHISHTKPSLTPFIRCCKCYIFCNLLQYNHKYATVR